MTVIPEARERFRRKLATYLRVEAELGEEAARAAALEGYSERQKVEMGRFIDGCGLAEGFAAAVPFLAQMGIEMKAVDVSSNGTDAALEILATCPCLVASEACGLERPSSVLCELDVEATRRAFPGLTVEILSRRVAGACACVFKYERSRR
jgi:predicted ArsR family transcriptional regulator